MYYVNFTDNICVTLLQILIKMPPKRAQWTEDNLRAALAAIERGQLTQRAVAERYNIPRRTLRNHINSKSTIKRLGRSSILTIDQEKDLVQRIIRFANIGVPVTPKVIRRQAFLFCENYDIKHNFNKDSGIAGKDWLKMFLKRNPEISKRKAQFMNPGRAQKLNRPIVAQHFQEVKDLYEELDILQNPQRLYNMDEKGCRLTIHHQQTVLAQKGARRVHLIAPEHAENVTIAMCVNAVGTAIPPMIIFKGQRQKPEYSDNLPAGSLVKMAPKGSMTTELFIEFIKHLGKYKTQGKVLLIFDGASSHLDYTIVEEADKHDIVLYCLPSNTTHELQPLDKSVNKSFEHHWDQEAMTYMYQNADRRLTKSNFNKIFSKAWSRALTHENIINGFRATGLFPFNPDVLPDEAFAPAILTEHPPPQTSTIIEANIEYPEVTSRYDTVSPSILNNEECTIADIVTPEKQIGVRALTDIATSTFPVKVPQSKNTNCNASTPSPKPSTSGIVTKRPLILSSDSETGIEPDAIQKMLNRNNHTRINLYTSEEDSDDDTPLASLKTKETKSPFQELMPTPNYAVIKDKPRRKAINYRGQRITRDLFKKREELKENEMIKVKKSKKANQKTKDRKNKSGKDSSKAKKSKIIESEWFCHACKEGRVSDMRQCVQCCKWYHEECVGLSTEDKDIFYCCDCD